MVWGKKCTDVKPAWEWEEDDFPLEERTNFQEQRRTGTLVRLSAVCLESKMVRLLAILMFLLKEQFMECSSCKLEGFFKGSLLKVFQRDTKHKVAGLQDTLFQISFIHVPFAENSYLG